MRFLLLLLVACGAPTANEPPAAPTPSANEVAVAPVEAPSAPFDMAPDVAGPADPAPELVSADSAPGEPAEPAPSAPALAASAAPAPVAVSEPVAAASDAEPVVADAASEPAAPAPVPARRYRLDPKRGWLFVIVRIEPSGLGGKLGHDHAITSKNFEGEVTWHPDDPSQCRFSVSVPVAALMVDPPGARERARLDPDGAVGDGAKDTIKKNFLASDQLDAARHAAIIFEGTQCSGTTGKVKVTGEFTMRGATRPVTMSLDVTEDGESFRARGGFTTSHTAFGFQPFSNLMGQFRNQDKLEFVVDVYGSPR